MERRKSNRRLHRKERLTTALLIKISSWAISIVLIASAITFIITYQSAHRQVIDSLQEEIALTLKHNQRRFSQVEQRAEVLEQQFLLRYQVMRDNQQQSLQKFDSWYQTTSPGVVRLSPKFNAGIQFGDQYFKHLSAFLGPRSQPISDELKIRTIAAQYTLNALGPGWQNHVANSHFSMPENVLILYSKTKPWGLLADEKLVITDFSVVKSTLTTENPKREPNWTGLYHDISVDEWTITYQRPVDINGQHLVNASFDITLDRLLTDLTSKNRSSAEHMVLNTEGHLIAASNLSAEAMAESAKLTPDSYQEPTYQTVSKIIAEQDISTLPNNLELEGNDKLVIINKIDGPNWWYVTLYPLAEIQKEALALPIKLVAAGTALVVIILLMVYWLVTKEVSRPLHAVAKVASLMGEKNYQDALHEEAANINAKGEVKQALNAFKTMASRFITAQHDLEKQVAIRTAELATANQKLDALAHMDGLTGLLNRRAFDRDLLAATQESDLSPYLVLFDIDSFKPYNDNYGHEAGDQALKKIAAYLKSNTAFNTYRYGGEEFAIIIFEKHVDDIKKLLNEVLDGIVKLAIEHRYGQTDTGVLTISAGAAPIVADDSPEHAIQRADKKLYEAKHSGRNRVCVGHS
ncbi:diguanylate cyclase [Idiomarina seosinensis]|uniref:diguanylate cyclase n=1 Tax=Idiomarina seosinensis TaxID=281739 RepID=A0A432ZE26_9GAMM|nr:diguanylate cyclase [Idiomarina seosinensis]RUO76144.1 GGDEF domain-containing protein [Idiomarina seosinensis]